MPSKSQAVSSERSSAQKVEPRFQPSPKHDPAEDAAQRLRAPIAGALTHGTTTAWLVSRVASERAEFKRNDAQAYFQDLHARSTPGYRPGDALLIDPPSMAPPVRKAYEDFKVLQAAVPKAEGVQSVLRKVTRYGTAAGAIISAASLYAAYRKDGGLGDNVRRTAVSLTGGALGGAAGGAALSFGLLATGTVLAAPVAVPLAIGASYLGATLGSWGAEAAYDRLKKARAV